MTDNVKSMGKGMIAIALVLALGLLTWIFQGAINRQYNPNQTVQTGQITDQYIEIVLKRNRAGHYVTSGRINSYPSVFLLDTGATYVAVPESLAIKIGLKKGMPVSLSTANGRTTGFQTMIDELDIGKIRLRNIRAVITPNLSEVLLGMSVLKQLEFTQRGGELRVRQYF